MCLSLLLSEKIQVFKFQVVMVNNEWHIQEEYLTFVGSIVPSLDILNNECPFITAFNVVDLKSIIIGEDVTSGCQYVPVSTSHPIHLQRKTTSVNYNIKFWWTFLDNHFLNSHNFAIILLNAQLALKLISV